MVNPPGIDHAACHQEAVKRTVLFVGKLDSRKGIDSVMEVARRLPQIPFEVAGWSDDLERIRAGAPDNVKIRGMLRGDALFDAYARARVFFFPSHAETFGLVILEAMASGCAVVSSVPLEFEGHRVTAVDLDDMTESVRALWEDPDETSRMGERNRRLAQQFTWKNHVDRLMGTYEELLEGVRASGTAVNDTLEPPLARSKREDG
jgi:glycosyltransferase involved in cell wall biosynthesis